MWSREEPFSYEVKQWPGMKEQRGFIQNEEPLKEETKRKRPESCSKSSRDRSIDEEEVPHRKSNQKCQRNDVDLEPRKTKSKSIGDIHFRHHHQTHLISILTRVNIETMRARKAQIPDLGWFLRRISTNTAYLQIWPNTPTLVLKLTSERQT